MKRKAKLALGGIALLLGTVVLSGCTASFCSRTDKAHMLYAYDYGITDYRAATDAEATKEVKAYIFKEDKTFEEITLANVKQKAYSDDEATARNEIYEYCSTYKSIDKTATKNGVRLPTIKFLETLDSVVLGHAIQFAVLDNKIAEVDIPNLTKEQIVRDYTDPKAEKGILDLYGYLKYDDTVNAKGKKLWTNYYTYVNEVKLVLGKDNIQEGIDAIPTTDYLSIYQSGMNRNISSLRSCLAIKTDDYGSYGPRKQAVEISAKKITDWRGLLEFILVWPIGAFLDVMTQGFLNAHVANGWAQLLSILVVTIVIRSIMLLFTFKQTKATAKMNELQPEIQKIQAKYPNSNTSQYDKQRMAAEMQKLYKKNHINPLSSLLVMIIQFPVFICVWGAMQGSAYLSTGSFLGLRLSDSIGSTIFSASSWKNGGGATALILFLLMAAAQTVAMLLPQWIQKRKAAGVAKLGKNPAQKSQANKMKWFTWIMLAMIILMGFSLASAMGVYWLVGALFSIGQTLITQVITEKNSKKNKGNRNSDVVIKKKGK